MSSGCLHPVARGAFLYPCGKCPECRQQYQEEMAQRLYLESRVSKSSWFLTLTYSDENMPLSDGQPCFDRDRIDQYLRALRDDLKRDKIHLRYFFTCEEGDLTNRIHYHALLYLDDFLSLQQVYVMCKKHWHGLGWISVSSTGIGCCKYVAKYCLKDLPTFREPRKFDDGSRNPHFPFRLFSNRPGLGCTDDCIYYYEQLFELNKNYIDWNQFEIDQKLTSSRIIPKIPRTVRFHMGDWTQYRLSSLGWSRFYKMGDELLKNFEDDFLNPLIDGERVPDYSRDLEIMKKRIKLRQLKKNVL